MVFQRVLPCSTMFQSWNIPEYSIEYTSKDQKKVYPDITPLLRHIALNVFALSPVIEFHGGRRSGQVLIRLEHHLGEVQSRDLLGSRGVFSMEVPDSTFCMEESFSWLPSAFFMWISLPLDQVLQLTPFEPAILQILNLPLWFISSNDGIRPRRTWPSRNRILDIGP